MIPPEELNISGTHGNNREELAGGFVEINSPCLEETEGGGLLIDPPSQTAPTSRSSLYLS